MPQTTDTTTLICLFHHDDQARAALSDLAEEGIAPSSIETIRASNSADHDVTTLESLSVPARDVEHLQEGLANGGTVIAVFALSEHVSTVERIFAAHNAGKIDEQDATPDYASAAPLAGIPLAAAGATAIPIVEEELQVGKRTVDQGGVRVYRRVVEIPAEASVTLREEHVVIERNVVDRPATAADLAQGNRSLELTETAEEAVVGKSARVVEEVLIGKQVGERTERIHDTVRRTEVEFEELTPGDSNPTGRTL